MKRSCLKQRITAKITRSKREVFLRADFEKLSGYDQVGRALRQLTDDGYDQVGRALRQLTDDGTLIKIGYGLYAKARLNRLTGQPMLAATGGFLQVAEEALRRLNVKWEASTATESYERGETQIPVNADVIVAQRFSRQIGTDKFKLLTAKTQTWK